jgi:hypothetical protein
MTGGNCLSSQIFQNKFSIGKNLPGSLACPETKEGMDQGLIAHGRRSNGEGEA